MNLFYVVKIAVSIEVILGIGTVKNSNFTQFLRLRVLSYKTNYYAYSAKIQNC